MIPKKFQHLFTKVTPHINLYQINPTGKHTIFYLHGGGFAYEMANYYYDFFHRLAKASDANIYIAIYPKTPKNTYQEILEMVYQSYQHVCTLENKIILMGDSAGGTLCYILAHLLYQNHQPQPQTIITISPWLQLASNHPQMHNIQKKDHFLTIPLLQKLAKDFAVNIELNNPLINPMSMPIQQLANSYILMGTYDILLPDAIDFTNQFNNVTLFTYDKAPHCFALLPQYETAFQTIISMIQKN